MTTSSNGDGDNKENTTQHSGGAFGVNLVAGSFIGPVRELCLVLANYSQTKDLLSLYLH